MASHQMSRLGVLIGVIGQATGMVLIMMVACLVGLFSLPLWVLIILRDLKWTEWFHTRYREFKEFESEMSRLR